MSRKNEICQQFTNEEVDRMLTRAEKAEARLRDLEAALIQIYVMYPDQREGMERIVRELVPPKENDAHE